MVIETSRIGRQLQLDSRVTLLDALREHLDLVSTKKGWDQDFEPCRKYFPRK